MSEIYWGKYLARVLRLFAVWLVLYGTYRIGHEAGEQINGPLYRSVAIDTRTGCQFEADRETPIIGPDGEQVCE